MPLGHDVGEEQRVEVATMLDQLGLMEGKRKGQMWANETFVTPMLSVDEYAAVAVVTPARQFLVVVAPCHMHSERLCVPPLKAREERLCYTCHKGHRTNHLSSQHTFCVRRCCIQASQ